MTRRADRQDRRDRVRNLRDGVAGAGVVLGLVLSLSVVAAACLPTTTTKSIGLPTARRTVSSTVVTTTTSTTAPTTTAPTTTSTTVPVTSTTTSTTVPATQPVGQDEQPSSLVDVCGLLQGAAAGSTVVVPAGTWALGACVVDGRGRAGVTVRSQHAATPTAAGGTTTPTSTMVGSLRCSDCDGWTFDGLVVRGDGTLPDPSHVVSMARGRGWTWTRCDLSPGRNAEGVPFGVRGVLSTWQDARDWQVTDCRIHDNGSSRPGVEDNNHDHLIYINGFASTTSANGRIGPGNLFERNSHGAPVKVGYGVDASNLPVGVRGVRVESNTIRDNASPDGSCGVLVAGDSPWTVVADNTIDCTRTPVEGSTSAVSIRHWPSGAQVRIERNTVVGARNAGLANACGAPVSSGGYDHTVTVRQWMTGWWFQVPADSCSWNGLTVTGNSTVAG